MPKFDAYARAMETRNILSNPNQVNTIRSIYQNYRDKGYCHELFNPVSNLMSGMCLQDKKVDSCRTRSFSQFQSILHYYHQKNHQLNLVGAGTGNLVYYDLCLFLGEPPSMLVYQPVPAPIRICPNLHQQHKSCNVNL